MLSQVGFKWKYTQVFLPGLLSSRGIYGMASLCLHPVWKQICAPLTTLPYLWSPANSLTDSSRGAACAQAAHLSLIRTLPADAALAGGYM